MNDFRQITVCAVDCLNPHLAARALERSMDQCDFADALLLTDTPVETRARVLPAPAIRSRRAYSHYLLRQLAEHIRTPHVLIVQWDGYVLDAGQWDSAFLAWDYVGGPWRTQDGRQAVGNGGFSLRSRRLLEVLAGPAFAPAEDEAVELEDQFICTLHRNTLESRHGIRYAPVDLAHRFAYDQLPPIGPSFGFHGLFNLWRHCSPQQVLALAREVTDPTFTGVGYINLLLTYVHRRDLATARDLLGVAFDRLGRAQALEDYRQAFPTPQDGQAFVDLCEQVMAIRVPAGPAWPGG